MKLIADSGSSKTDWILIDSDLQQKTFQCRGMNPYQNSDSELLETLSTSFSEVHTKDIFELYFYGSGCNMHTQERMKEVLRRFFTRAKIEVHSDILGAARALFGQKEGLAGILGTGSNTVLYQNGEIVKGIESMGYILGDEGSGAVLGQSLLKAWLRKEMPEDIRIDFESTYKLLPETIRERVYKQGRPNQYLASFAPFAATHRSNFFIRQLLHEHFIYYFKYQVLSLIKSDHYTLGLVGGIASAFEEEIKEIAQEFQVTFLKSLSRPIQNLAQYHV